jgi:hypothetical protein
MRSGFIQDRLNSPDKPKVRAGRNSGLKDPVTTCEPLFFSAIEAAAQAWDVLPADVRTGTDLDSVHARWTAAMLVKDNSKLCWKEISAKIKIHATTLQMRYRLLKDWTLTMPKFAVRICEAQRLFSDIAAVQADPTAQIAPLATEVADPIHGDVLPSSDSSEAIDDKFQPARPGGRAELLALMRTAQRNQLMRASASLHELRMVHSEFVLREAFDLVMGARR